MVGLLMPSFIGESGRGGLDPVRVAEFDRDVRLRGVPLGDSSDIPLLHFECGGHGWHAREPLPDPTWHGVEVVSRLTAA